MKEITKAAKTIKEATEEGLKELKLSSEEATIEVIQESTKRLFGLMGKTDAIVRIVGDKAPDYLSKKFLNELLTKMDIFYDIKTSIEGETLNIEINDINSSDKGILIGKRGATLDSLQHLTSLVVNRGKENYTRVNLDIENYREKREQTLIELAKKLSNTVKRTKRIIKLEPMNPYERRIIHSTLYEDRGITTYSEGEDPHRRVVIQLKK